MHSNPELELTYKIANVPVSYFPFPHFYIRDIFPADFYRDLIANLPDHSAMLPIGEVRPVKGYKERFVLQMSPQYLAALPEAKRKFWEECAQWMMTGKLTNYLLNKFSAHINERFKNVQSPIFYNECMLIEDITNYSIGPHSDSPKKVISVLFYLPKDDSQANLGTSIYVPKEASFTCPGGPHYGFENFSKVHTMPFLPNSVFVFLKTANSFHGVEPVTTPDRSRWVFLFDIYVKQPPVS